MIDSAHFLILILVSFCHCDKILDKATKRGSNCAQMSEVLAHHHRKGVTPELPQRQLRSRERMLALKLNSPETPNSIARGGLRDVVLIHIHVDGIP